MELSPHLARSTTFKTVRKGYDPDEVAEFQQAAATAIEDAQNRAAAFEAKARGLATQLQQAQAEPASDDTEQTEANREQADVISRTLLLAQRTADQTVADANTEAERIVSEASVGAAEQINQARSQAAKIIEAARTEARQAAQEARESASAEVQSLLAKRDFLAADVDALETHVRRQREQLRAAGEALLELSDETTGGLAEARRPMLSASDATPVAGTATHEAAAPSTERETAPTADGASAVGAAADGSGATVAMADGGESSAPS